MSTDNIMVVGTIKLIDTYEHRKYFIESICNPLKISVTCSTLDKQFEVILNIIPTDKIYRVSYRYIYNG